VFKEMLSLLHVENYRIHAYSHQENGMVERAIKEVERHARALCYELRATSIWDEEVLKVQGIMNEHKSSATGLSPNQIVFSGKIDLHAGRLYPQPTIGQRQSMSKYMKDQIDLQDSLMKVAEKHQDETNAKHMRNNVDREIRHEVGQYIVVHHENGTPPHKMAVRWHGPYRIIEVLERPQGTIYTTVSPKDGKVADYHASVVMAHPCANDLEAAKSAVLDDDNTFIVEQVVAHEVVKVSQRDKLNLTIKWLGYPIPEISVINASLRRNVLVQAYLRQHNLMRFGNPAEMAQVPQPQHVKFHI